MKILNNNIKKIFSHTLFRGSAIYFSAIAINSIISFIMVPIFTRYLTPYDYGVMSTVQVSLSILSIVVCMGMGDSIPVNYYKFKNANFNTYLKNLIVLLCLCFMIVFIFVLAFEKKIINNLNIPHVWLYLAIPTILTAALFSFSINLLVAQEKVLLRSFFILLHSLTAATLSLYFVMVLKLDWRGRLLGLFLTSYLFGIIGFIILKKKWGKSKFQISISDIKDTLRFGLPLVPYALSGQIMLGIDRFFINSMIDVAHTGIYSVGYQMGMLVSIVGSSFNSIWTPFFYRKLSEKNANSNRNIVKFTYFLFAIFILSAILWGISAPYVLKYLLGSEFQGSSKFVIWIAIGYAFESIYSILSGYIFYTKKTYIFTIIGCISALINMFFTYFLIKINGVIGAAQATCLTYILFALMAWFASSKIYNMPWRLNFEMA